MRSRRVGQVLLIMTFGLAPSAWVSDARAQGGGATGRGQPAPGATAAGTTAQQAGRGGGARGGGGSGADGFFNFDPMASSGIAIPDTPPTETHQKITVNGEAVAYTARAGYLPLRNATTGQSAAHLFFTFYARDGAGDASTRPVMFFLGGAPGVAASWQELGGLGPKRMKWASDGTAGLPPYGWVDNPHTLARRRRPRVREPGRHRLQPSRPAEPRPGVLDDRCRRGLAG